MKKLFAFAIGLWLVASTVFTASAAFSSLYVFGDALSSTTDNPDASDYYNHRYSNGRVWVEVLAQRQGLIYDATKNISYWDHNSSNLVKELKNFTAPADVASDLFIVWVCNADTFDATSTAINSQNTDANLLLNQFMGANNQAQAYHLQIITNLYAKGVRNLILPNVVDISEIPAFNNGNLTSVLRGGCVDYNAKFANTINQAIVLCPGLTIYAPDFYSLLNNVLTNAASYGLTNALSGGFSIDALDSLYVKPPTILNGPGTNYIFWDPQDPTAMFHEIIADIAQQIISPVQISALKQINGSNRLDVVNMPVGLNGFLDGSTNPVPGSWTLVTGFNSTNTTQSLFVATPPLVIGFGPPGSGGSGGPPTPGSGTDTNSVSNTNLIPYFISASQFYRLRFPYAWNWP